MAHNTEELEEAIIKMNDEEILQWAFTNNLILREMKCCGSCDIFLKLESAPNYIDKYAFRCYSKNCSYYQKKRSVRDCSFFESFGMHLKTILKVLIRYSCNQQRCSILSSIDISAPSLKKILLLLNTYMKNANSKEKKLGGFGTHVQVDETMLNYKCKSHRGRSTSNKTDAITIVEVKNGVTTKVHAEIIIDKSINTIMPIILNKVITGTTIKTDEHKTYTALVRNGFSHHTVCHKYNFVDPITRVHIQNVENFNNYIKHEIKKRKGVRTVERAEFLVEMVWCWNNKFDLLNSLFELIKI